MYLVIPWSSRVLQRCTNRTNPSAWHTLESCRSRIASYVTSSTASLGVKLCAVKFLERFMLVGLRGVSDPRVTCVLFSSLYSVLTRAPAGEQE